MYPGVHSFYLLLLWAMGVCSLPGVCGLSPLPPEVCILPDASDVSLEDIQGAHSPQCFVFGMPPTTLGEHQVACCRGDWSYCCSRIPQTAPQCHFLFEKMLLLYPAAPYKEGPVLTHSSRGQAHLSS